MWGGGEEGLLTINNRDKNKDVFCKIIISTY
jgi:hypothetical protein